MLYGGLFDSLDPSSEESLAQLESVMIKFMADGDLIGFLAVAGALVTCPLCYFLGGMRKGFTGARYLALRRPPAGSTVIWLGGFGAMVTLSAVLLPVTDDNAPGFMVDAVNSTTAPLVLILGLVVGAPFLEEFVFRGLLFRGWRGSALGLHGTVMVTSFLWTALHIGQYGLGVLFLLFGMGLLFGYARHWTGSLWVPIAMHALNNGIATAEIYRFAG
jgi:membrane protease YdiL (CAAX protease family)